MGAPAPSPSPNGANGDGRDRRGRFALGNPGGPGNPYARRVAELRAALLNAVTPEDVAELARALLTQAKAGDVAAARLVLSYAVGRPAEAPDAGQTADDWPAVGEDDRQAVAERLLDDALETVERAGLRVVAGGRDDGDGG